MIYSLLGSEQAGLYGAAYRVLLALSGFLVIVILVRELGRSDFGRYTVALAVVSVLTYIRE